MSELKPNLAEVAAAPKRVRIVLSENELIPPTGLFVGDNGVSYILRAGEEVDVPVGVVEILSNAITSVPTIDPDTLTVIGYKPKKMYPFERV